MAAYHLQIVTPDRVAYDGNASRLIVRSLTGDVCILPGHIDYAAPLAIGQACVTFEDGTVRSAACNGGLLTVSSGNVRLMATTFEWEDEIDLVRAEQAKENAEQRLKELQREDADFAIAEAKLKRAIARIGAARD